MQFSNDDIDIALFGDAAALVKLLNEAYRGENSKKGWTTEAHLIAGNTRTTVEEMQAVLQTPGSVLLKYVIDGQIVGCVNLQQKGQKIYLGMLSVQPAIQSAGIGKKILQAAEEYASSKKCSVIYMTVISVRHELIAWYKRHGYADTGERKPFVEDGISGKHLVPLEFAVLEKLL